MCVSVSVGRKAKSAGKRYSSYPFPLIIVCLLALFSLTQVLLTACFLRTPVAPLFQDFPLIVHLTNARVGKYLHSFTGKVWSSLPITCPPSCHIMYLFQRKCHSASSLFFGIIFTTYLPSFFYFQWFFFLLDFCVYISEGSLILIICLLYYQLYFCIGVFPVTCIGISLFTLLLCDCVRLGFLK